MGEMGQSSCQRMRTLSPMSMVKVLLAVTASSTVSRLRRRSSGFIVVSHSCCGIISPSPAQVNAPLTPVSSLWWHRLRRRGPDDVRCSMLCLAAWSHYVRFGSLAIRASGCPVSPRAYLVEGWLR
jgi:hypothetical protein